jgi:simple sugar transport system substrate-binding protein
MRHARSRLWALVLALALVAAACGADEGTTTTAAGETTTTGEAPGEPLTFGMILVGPQDDRGWSQAHREAGEYVEEKLGATMIVIDKVNPADRPDTPLTQIVDDMIDQGAQLIFATSDDMKDGILEAAAAHPDVPMVWSSGDSAWEDGKAFAGLDNLANVMGEMEYGKMMAGCAAALKSETGSIGYVGPLINDETRRLVNATYLGARYCWEEYRGADPAELTFAVNWIGFWFQIPGVTLDPTQVTNEFLDGGADVVISGIDTTEALVRTGQRAAAGETLWAVPYDYEGACEESPEICLGVPFFHWGPAYLEIAQSVLDGTFTAQWQWLGPDWSDINNPDTSIIGFVKGEGLGDAEADLDAFIAELAGGLELWTGPLNYQDGSTFLAEGEVATELQVWYMPQLLEGVIGASS